MLSPSLVVKIMGCIYAEARAVALARVKHVAPISLCGVNIKGQPRKRRAIVLKLFALTQTIREQLTHFIQLKASTFPQRTLILAVLYFSHSVHANQDTEAALQDSEVSESEPRNTPPERVYIDRKQRFKRNMMLLNDHNQRGENHWLTTDEGEFLTIFQPSNRADTKGNVILIPDSQQHGDWPTWVRPIREQLAEFGWNTVSFSVHLKPAVKVVKREPPKPMVAPNIDDSESPAIEKDGTESNENKKEDEKTMANAMAVEEMEKVMADTAMMSEPKMTEKEADQTPQTPYPEVVTQQLNVILDLIQSKSSGPLAIIGIGDGALWAAHYTQALNQQRENENVAGVLVMINANNQVNYSLKGELSIEDIRNYLKIPTPVLDLYTASNTPRINDAYERKAAASRHGFQQYVQQKLPRNQPSPDFIANRITGFITARTAEN